MKMIGIDACTLASSCCSSSPLRPGSWTSSTRQLGPSGRGRVRNSWAEANVWTVSPMEQSRSRRLSRMDWSSSTTQTHGSSLCMAAPPSGVGPPSQHQHILSVTPGLFRFDCRDLREFADVGSRDERLIAHSSQDHAAHRRIIPRILERRAQILPCPLIQRVERSEEHTSELQSQSNLVCRLL